MLRPLKLRIQRAPQPAGPTASDLPVASVWVDSGIAILTEPFSYLIPEKISSQIKIGSRVQVPFKDKHLEGIVIDRTPFTPDAKEFKSIYKLLGDFPVASQETIELISLTASFWGGSPHDVVRSAIPPRVASAEKSLALTPTTGGSKSESNATFHLLPPKVEPVAVTICNLPVGLVVPIPTLPPEVIRIFSEPEVKNLKVPVNKAALFAVALIPV